MKIILSRKGFDSANGGCASPILGKTMLSMPIPEGKTSDVGRKFSGLHLGEYHYDELWQALGKKKYIADSYCHLDPDLRQLGICDGWQPAFGQCSSSETHLQNQGVQVGDVFLFFGWFRQAEKNPTGKTAWRYVRKTPDIQAIYGYLQIGEILRGEAIAQRCPWHPHASPSHQATAGNTLYLPASELDLDGAPAGLPGCGTFQYADDLKLTKDGLSRSRWKLKDWMRTCYISHHTEASIHDDYFQSASIGQEFVVADGPVPLAWAAELFRNHQQDLRA